MIHTMADHGMHNGQQGKLSTRIPDSIEDTKVKKKLSTELNELLKLSKMNIEMQQTVSYTQYPEQGL